MRRWLLVLATLLGCSGDSAPPPALAGRWALVYYASNGITFCKGVMTLVGPNDSLRGPLAISAPCSFSGIVTLVALPDGSISGFLERSDSLVETIYQGKWTSNTMSLPFGSTEGVNASR